MIHQEDVIVVSHQPWCPLTSVRIYAGDKSEREVQRLVKEAKG